MNVLYFYLQNLATLNVVQIFDKRGINGLLNEIHKLDILNKYPFYEFNFLLIITLCVYLSGI